ncbi:MAG: hypothetical protein ACFFFK_10220 [Candidatus Thorarchaeota archaeon]
MIATNKGRDSQGPSTSEKRTMLYAPGSEDVAGEAYFPGRKDGAMPFPVGKRQERKKTETFRKSAEDKPRD